MRIIAGNWRGRVLVAPPGDATRPTTDRVREAVMSAVYSAAPDFEELCIIDAFAGSGALGLEALSRNARFVQAFEQDRHALQALDKNLKNLGVDRDIYNLCRRDVYASSIAAPYTFGLIFFDPPYKTSPLDVLNLFERWDQEGRLTKDVLVVYEQSSKNAVIGNKQAEEKLTELGLCLLKHKKYGDTIVDIFQKG